MFSGDIRVQQATSYEPGMNEWHYSNTDIAPPSYLEVKAIVDGWVDQFTLERYNYFEKGSS